MNKRVATESNKDLRQISWWLEDDCLVRLFWNPSNHLIGSQFKMFSFA